jgi:diacylglycerol diphosphate phosphatase / phosphatidate phosphatase
MFFLNNLNIQYPHALIERVSVGWNIFYSGAVPLFTLILFLGLSKANLHKFHVTVLGFFISYIPPYSSQLFVEADSYCS